jgi:hypothetical protein
MDRENSEPFGNADTVREADGRYVSTFAVQDWGYFIGPMPFPKGKWTIEVVDLKWFFAHPPSPASEILTPLGKPGTPGPFTLPNVNPYGLGICAATQGGGSGKINFEWGPRQVTPGIMEFDFDVNPNYGLLAGVNDTPHWYGDNSGSITVRLTQIR